MLGFNGGRLGTRNATTAGVLGASGLWLPSEQCTSKRAGAWPWGPNEVPNIGDPFGGGFFAGYISHTANGVPTHALIVAPRATGASGAGYPVTTNRLWGNIITTGVQSTFDGAANTATMVALGISNFPAAQFCVNLTLGGFTDWYLPSVFELAIAYANLKPTTELNSTSSGINSFAVPPRATNYTTTVPAQTTVAAFSNTLFQAFTTTSGAALHWSSTQATGGSGGIFYVSFPNGSSASNITGASSSVRTRAFRRIAL